VYASDYGLQLKKSPTIPTILFAEHFLFLTLTPSNRLTIAHIVSITGSIIPVIRTGAAMLTATGANILKPNHSTTAIANHRYLFLSYLYIGILPAES
jgi:hypothetical protein